MTLKARILVFAIVLLASIEFRVLAGEFAQYEGVDAELRELEQAIEILHSGSRDDKLSMIADEGLWSLEKILALKHPGSGKAVRSLENYAKTETDTWVLDRFAESLRRLHDDQLDGLFGHLAIHSAPSVRVHALNWFSRYDERLEAMLANEDVPWVVVDLLDHLGVRGEPRFDKLCRDFLEDESMEVKLAAMHCLMRNERTSPQVARDLVGLYRGGSPFLNQIVLNAVCRVDAKSVREHLESIMVFEDEIDTRVALAKALTCAQSPMAAVLLRELIWSEVPLAVSNALYLAVGHIPSDEIVHAIDVQFSKQVIELRHHLGTLDRVDASYYEPWPDGIQRSLEQIALADDRYSESAIELLASGRQRSFDVLSTIVRDEARRDSHRREALHSLGETLDERTQVFLSVVAQGSFGEKLAETAENLLNGARYVTTTTEGSVDSSLDPNGYQFIEPRHQSIRCHLEPGAQASLYRVTPGVLHIRGRFLRESSLWIGTWVWSDSEDDEIYCWFRRDEVERIPFYSDGLEKVEFAKTFLDVTSEEYALIKDELPAIQMRAFDATDGWVGLHIECPDDARAIVEFVEEKAEHHSLLAKTHP